MIAHKLEHKVNTSLKYIFNECKGDSDVEGH